MNGPSRDSGNDDAVAVDVATVTVRVFVVLTVEELFTVDVIFADEVLEVVLGVIVTLTFVVEVTVTKLVLSTNVSR